MLKIIPHNERITNIYKILSTIFNLFHGISGIKLDNSLLLVYNIHINIEKQLNYIMKKDKTMRTMKEYLTEKKLNTIMEDATVHLYKHRTDLLVREACVLIRELYDPKRTCILEENNVHANVNLRLDILDLKTVERKEEYYRIVRG